MVFQISCTSIKVLWKLFETLISLISEFWFILKFFFFHELFKRHPNILRRVSENNNKTDVIINSCPYIFYYKFLLKISTFEVILCTCQRENPRFNYCFKLENKGKTKKTNAFLLRPSNWFFLGSRNDSGLLSTNTISDSLSITHSPT